MWIVVLDLYHRTTETYQLTDRNDRYYFSVRQRRVQSRPDYLRCYSHVQRKNVVPSIDNHELSY